jgi:hypothetical protein
MLLKINLQYNADISFKKLMRKGVFTLVSMLKMVIMIFYLLIEKICDMVESGVVDSFAVIKTLLQDSVSLAGMLITTECLVVKDKSYERNDLTIHLYI